MAKLIEWLLRRAPDFLKSLPKDKLAELAASLSRRIGQAVPDNVAGIMAAIRKWVEENPKMAFVVIDALITVGFTGVEELLASHMAGAEKGSAESVLAEAVLRKLKEERARATGDGRGDSYHGVLASESGDPLSAEDRAIVNENIAKAVAVIGSVELVVALRAVMFYEDEDFRRFRTERVATDRVFKSAAQQAVEAIEFDQLLDDWR